MTRHLANALFIILALSLNAQNQKESLEFRVTLRDGNIMTGKSCITSVPLITDYGKLEIPAKFINSIEFGIQADKSGKQKIYNLLNQLGARNIPQNKDAYEELINMEITAIPVIENYIENRNMPPDTISEFTAENALIELKSKHSISDNYSTKDIIVFDDNFRIGGFYELPSVSLKTEYGDLQIKREKISKVEIMYYSEDDTETRFTLYGNKHISSNTGGGWLNTGLYVKSGQNIAISASGEVSFASLSGYKYTPDGKTSSYKYSDTYSDYSYSTYPTYGNVVFKIGENGTMLKAGEKFSARAAASGILFISIYEVVYNAANTGSYSVKVKVK